MLVKKQKKKRKRARERVDERRYGHTKAAFRVTLVGHEAFARCFSPRCIHGRMEGTAAAFDSRLIIFWSVHALIGPTPIFRPASCRESSSIGTTDEPAGALRGGLRRDLAHLSFAELLFRHPPLETISRTLLRRNTRPTILGASNDRRSHAVLSAKPRKSPRIDLRRVKRIKWSTQRAKDANSPAIISSQLEKVIAHPTSVS